MTKHERKQVNNRKMVSIPPDDAIIQALLRTGYKWYEAVLDIIDNCIDAIKDVLEADDTFEGRIFVHTEQDDGKITRIIIGDTGSGIPADVLPHILALGKSLKRATAKLRPRLGVFGMGLKSAGMSLAEDITVISRVEGEEVVYANWRPAEDGFNCESDISTDRTKLFEEKIGSGSGTLVVFDDLRAEGRGQTDLPETPNSFYTTLKKHAAHTYRHILNPKSQFHVPFEFKVGKSDVPKDWDPLMIGHPDTTVLIGDETTGDFVKYTTPAGHILWIRMIHHRRDSGGDLSANREKYENTIGMYMPGNHYKQGAYWIRMGREIYRGHLWEPKQGISNIYTEILFDDTGLSTDDSPIQMDFGKTDVLIESRTKEYLIKSVCMPQVKKRLTAVQKEARDKKSTDMDELTEMLSKEILSPNTKGNNQSARTRSFKKRITAAANTTARTNSTYRGQKLSLDGSTNVQYDIEFRAWPGDIPFDFEDEGTRYVLVLNEHHRFIIRSILETHEKGDTQGAAYIIQICAALAMAFTHSEVPADKRADTFEMLGHLLNLYDDSFGRCFPEPDDSEESSEIIIIG